LAPAPSKALQVPTAGAPETSVRTVLRLLRDLEASAAELSMVSTDLATKLPALRDQLGSGRSLSEVDALPAFVGSRAELNHAILTLQYNFRSVIGLLYATARSGGQSIGAIARAWGVSRPLVSKVLGQEDWFASSGGASAITPRSGTPR